MKRKCFKRIFIIIISIMTIFTAFQNRTYAAPQDVSKLDVVFILDASISMAKSDPQNLRYEAIRLYMDMCSAEGNRIGIVAYGGELVGEKVLTDISAAESRAEISQYLKNLSLVSYTDTGIGLKKAIEILEQSGDDKETKKALVLLSDGKNEPKRSAGQCTDDTNAALEHAKEKGYHIYTIGLNADGTVDSSLLEGLSLQTGVKNYITSDASDLNSILQEIYTANTTSKIINTGTAEGDKDVSASIQITGDSVEKATVTVLHTQPVTMTLTDPAGTIVTLPSDNAALLESATYSLIKLNSPASGTWSLKVNSPTGEKITVNYVLSYKLKANMNIENSDKVKRGDSVNITVYLMNNGERVSNPEEYKGLEAIAMVYGETGELMQQVPLTLDESGNCFKGSYSFDKTGKFSLEGQVQGKTLYSVSEPIELNLENSQPVFKGNEKSIKLTIGEEKVINLDEFFSDSDSDSLTYSAVSHEEGLNINVSGNSLTLKSDSKLKGTIDLTADDGNGGVAAETISFEVAEGNIFTNILSRLRTLTTMQLVVAGVPIAVVLLIIILLWAIHKRRKKRKSTKGGIILKGQIMLNVVDNNTGEVFPPQFLKLKNYTKGVTIFNLLSSLPEYSETSKIKLFASVDNIISIKNDSDCIITKNKAASQNNKWMEMSPNDVAEIRLGKTPKSIMIKYLP